MEMVNKLIGSDPKKTTTTRKITQKTNLKLRKIKEMHREIFIF